MCIRDSSWSVNRSLAERMPQSGGGSRVKSGRSSMPGSGSPVSARSRSQSWVATAHRPWVPCNRSGRPEVPTTAASSGRSNSTIDPWRQPDPVSYTHLAGTRDLTADYEPVGQADLSDLHGQTLCARQRPEMSRVHIAAGPPSGTTYFRTRAGTADDQFGESAPVTDGSTDGSTALP